VGNQPRGHHLIEEALEFVEAAARASGQLLRGLAGFHCNFMFFLRSHSRIS
jgi:hypothetical protein